MARAKRTDRADARRRYRASLEPAAVATEETDAVVEPNRLRGQAVANQVASSASVGSAGKPGRPADVLASEPVARRPGFLGSVTGAITPLDLRGDLAALPALATRTRAIWLPSLIVAACGALLLIPSLASNTIVAVVVPIFVFPPPMAGPFLAGILAPRAGWLAGGIVGLLAGIFYSAFVATAQVASNATPVTSAERLSIVTSTLVISPLFGIIVGGFAAFYRRFLRLSNPNAGARGSARSGGKPGGRGSKPAAKRR